MWHEWCISPWSLRAPKGQASRFMGKHVAEPYDLTMNTTAPGGEPVHTSIATKFMIGVTAALVTVLGVNLGLDIRQQRAQAEEDLREQARMVATQVIAMREFIARNQDRINRDSHGHFEFKYLNPAAVGRGVGQIFAEMSDYQYKQTRLQVRMAENMPDAFEVEALRRFASHPDLAEVVGYTGSGQDRVFRYMVPLKMEASCLPCHGPPAGEPDIAGYPKEGLQVGELAGALSITIPTERFEARLTQSTRSRATVIVLATGLSLALIGFLNHQLVARPLAALAGVTRRIGQGRWEVPEEVVRDLRAHQETSPLVDAIQAMSDELQALYRNLEQKVAERTRQLQEAHADLEALHRSQTEFYSAMTHEFRTPLTSIIGFSQLLLSPGGDPLTPGQREHLKDILESAQRLLQLVNDLLDASRLQAGQMPLRIAAVDLGEAVQEALAVVRPLAQQREITVTCHIPADLPLVAADDLRVLQILLNLLSNAIKFTQVGGEVALTAEARSDLVQVSVRDNGPGIPPEDHEVIFQLFRRGSAHERTGGSGLGLALAKLLVELHGGRIWVESRPGCGSTFHFTLPVHGGEPRCP
ncbi:MAG: histidine kinase [Symbiobacterium thermophilum]|uniref:histidine kinase n=1 Tax=Symbiobacterium thermophilum TaxID=2734 RepID=A0A953I0B9_SYMTR|nr:histidine kinase [Symbiobacterium thermophilum]